MHTDDARAFGRVVSAIELLLSIHPSASEVTLRLFGAIVTSPGVRQRELSDRFEIGDTTVSKHLKYLKEARLVQDQLAPNESRALMLYPTATGEALAEKMVRTACGAR